MIPRTIGEGTSVDETNIGHRTNGQCPTIDVVDERMYEGMSRTTLRSNRKRRPQYDSSESSTESDDVKEGG